MIFEREHEIGLVAKAITRALSSSEGSVFYFEGPGGIGKTSLLLEIAKLALANGMRVLKGCAAELERDYALGLVVQILESDIDNLDADTLKERFRGSSRLLLPLFSHLPTAGRLSSTTAESPYSQSEMFLAIYGFIAGLANKTPLLILVDDLHWADISSIQFFSFILRRLSSLRAVFIFAARPGNEWGADLNRVDFLRGSNLAPISLAPLSLSSVSMMLLDQLGQKPQTTFSQECLRVSAGNPFYLTELIRESKSRGISPTEKSVPGLSQLTPPRIVEMISSKLHKLPKESVKLVESLAILGDGAPLYWITQLSELQDIEITDACEKLQKIGIISEARDHRFAHPLIQSAVYESISPTRRDVLHNRAANIALMDRAKAQVVLAHYLRTSLVPKKALTELMMIAAQEALASGAIESAISYLTRAKAENSDEDSVEEISLQLGRALALSRVASAREHLLPVTNSNNPDRRIRAALALWSSNSFDGNFQEGVDVLHEVLFNSPDGDQSLVNRLQLELARGIRSWRPTAQEGKEMIDSLRDSGNQFTPELERVKQGLISYDLLLANRPVTEVVAHIKKALPISDQVLHETESQLLHMPFYTLIYCDELELAHKVLDDFSRLKSSQESLMGSTISNLWRMFAYFRSGDLFRAERLGASVFAASFDHGWLFGMAASQLWLAEIAIERADLETASTLYLALENQATPDSEFSNKGWANHILFGLAQYKAYQGNYRQSLDEILEIGRRHDEFLAFCPSELPWRADAAICAKELGMIELSGKLIDEELVLSEHFGAPRGLGKSMLVHGQIHQSQESLQRAVAILETSCSKLEFARACIWYGIYLNSHSQGSKARDFLFEGYRLAEQLGSNLLTELARGKLEESGFTFSKERVNNTVSLSSAELRVANLAIRGLSNPEIGSKLYIGRRTVETHLYNIYKKLGIGSRFELPDALRAASGID